MAYIRLTDDLNVIQKLDTEPNDIGGLSADELKAKFDEAANIVKTYINEVLLPAMEGNEGANNVGIETISAISTATNVQDALIQIVQLIQGISQGSVPDGSITSQKLADAAVTAVKMAENAVDSSNIFDNAIISAKLAALCVTTAKLAAKCVTSSKIADNAVGTEQLANSSVTNGKLASDAVQTSNIYENAVSASKLADAAVTREKIAAGAVSGRYAVTIPSVAASWARWNGSADNAWYTEITVSGVRSSDRGDLLLQRGISSAATPSLAGFEQDAENFSHIVAANITADDTLRVFADEIPANDIYCFLRVVKK